MKKNEQLTVANIYHLPWTAVEKDKGGWSNKKYIDTWKGK